VTDGKHEHARMIDRWFPCAAVDAAVGTPGGSGRNEKALFPWFASRPIAQARAAALTALLPDDPNLRAEVVNAVASGDLGVISTLASRIRLDFGRAPVVLDMFSGRGLIPLEAARAGATAIGTDLSPVATLAGRLLADWPLRDWSTEPTLPYRKEQLDGTLDIDATPRIVADARVLHVEIGRRLEMRLAHLYPTNADGSRPWGYLWMVTMPCDNPSCRRRFPLFGSAVLRHPYERTRDAGQSFRLIDLGDDSWAIEVHEGPAEQEPSYSSSGRKGKSARCPFCQHIHSLETVKAKGAAGHFTDEPVIAADFAGDTKKVFRTLRADERDAVQASDPTKLESLDGLSAVPDEAIPPGNVHTVMASGYGYDDYGALMCRRQTLMFGTLAGIIRDSYQEMLTAGVSQDYATAQVSIAAATFVRMLKYATRGARLRAHGSTDGKGQNRVQIDHIFSNEASLAFQFDFFEAGIGSGPGTWAGLTDTGLKPLATHIDGPSASPARLRRANAMALPFRDATIDAVITDPPYYDMIEYADASDYFYVWLRRILSGAQSDLFAEAIGTTIGRDLQNKDDEIIVRRVYNGGVKHDRDFYESSLARAFSEARRVLRPDGHMVVVFGHSDPEAW
jgi:putative DNA methylase